MVKENISQEFRLKNIYEKRNYFVEEIELNELMSQKHKMVSTTLNYIEHFQFLVCVVTGCTSISAFAFLLDIPVGITCSTTQLKICAITVGIKKDISILRKRRRNIKI